MELIGRIYLAAGARRVMPPTFSYLPIETEPDLARIGRQVSDNTDITLHCSHPQGGNPISRDPPRASSTRSSGSAAHPSVYVCDASVFPSAITVNPQLTVMALADYASARIS